MTDLTSPHTLAALHLMRASGRHSFEQMIADLLSQLAGVPFRLARAGGPQGGADAFAPTAIAMEAKRYDSSTLGERELRGEIDQAAENPDLELWVLCASTRLGVQKRRGLETSASRQGVALLVLDTGGFPPLPPDVPALAALCATGAERVVEVLAKPDWLDPKREEEPARAAVQEELARLGSLPGFARFRDEVRTMLRELPTWRRLVERQNAGLLRKIQTDAETYFGTPFDPRRAVTRSLQAEVAAWCSTAQAATEPELAILLGERYDGKTWCLYGWLAADLLTCQLPVFLVSSRAGDQGVPLFDQLVAQAREALGPSHLRHAEAVLRRRMNAARGDTTPWCVLVLEGLNEYKFHPDNRFEHLAWALARGDPERRPCASLCTVRRSSWDDIEPRVNRQAHGRIRRFHIQPYNDDELARGLALEGLAREWFDARSATVQDLLRRPRYLHLAAEHADRLGRFAAVTEEVLHWLDLTDKIRRTQPGAPADWGENSYQGVLRDLARQHLDRPVLHLDDVVASLRRFTDEAHAALRQLESEGVLRNVGDRYDIRPDGLRAGMGLFILYRLEDAAANGRPLAEELHDLLAPLQDTDQTIAYVGDAAVFSLLAPAGHYAPAIIDALITAWLGSRNLSRDDVGKVRELAPPLLGPLLRLAPDTWSLARDNAQLQEVSTLLFVDALRERRELMSIHLRRWLRTVPTRGSWVIANRQESEGRIAAQLASPHLARFGLVARSDSGCLRLHNVALYLETRHPGLLEPEDCLALIAAQHVAVAPSGDSQKLVLRRILGSVPLTWFEEQAGGCLGSADGASIFHGLLVAGDREDLAGLLATVSNAPPRAPAFDGGTGLSRERYEQILAAPPDTVTDTIELFRAARHLVIDPELPKPSDELLARCRESWFAHFSAVRLQLVQVLNSDDLDFDATVPAVAAWAPEAGAAVIRQQIADLPPRLAVDQHWWALGLRQHAVLAEGETRDALRTLSETDYPNIYGQLAAGFSLLVLMPAMSPVGRVEAVLDHHTMREWRTLFDFIEDLADEGMVSIVEAHLDGETDPRRLLRARLLLVTAGEDPLSPARVQALIRDLPHADAEARHGILAVAVRRGVREIPPELLLPIATDTEDTRSTLPRWSASLLARQGAYLDRLPAYWQAVGAVTSETLRQQFLTEVERALFGHTALPEALALDGPTIEIRLGCDARPASRRISLPLPAEGVTFMRPESTIGGLSQAAGGGFGEELRRVLDEDAAFRRRDHIQAEVVATFERHQYDVGAAWSSEKFPQALVDDLEAGRFTRWIEALLAKPAAELYWFWYGVLVSVFRRALREGHLLTSGLWRFVQPFQRGTEMRPVRFMHGAVDWCLVELSSTAADERTARTLLRQLILDSRTDGELLDVAVGGRYRDVARLTDIALALLQEPDPEVRTRGARIAGWLPGTETQLQALASVDPSMWVRRVASIALEDRARERFARHWLRRFLGEGSREERWGAGQLFLACIDAASSGWTKGALSEEVVDVRRRGEALLLLAAAEEPTRQARQKLDKTFLEHEVSNLEEICRPWHQQKDWDEVA
jgi:hypothetical protein